MAELKIQPRASRIVTVTWPADFTVADVDRYAIDFARALRALQFFPVVVVNDVREVKLGSIDRAVTKRVEQFMYSEKELLAERLCGWADITTSWAFRSVLALVRLKSETAFPRETFGTVEDAEKGAAKLLVHGRAR